MPTTSSWATSSRRAPGGSPPPPLIDATAHDALFCTFDHRGMGASTDAFSATKSLTRAEQDEHAARSHERAAAAR